MRPVPIPKHYGGDRVIIGESDPTRDDVRPCEYLVTASALYPGRGVYSALIELDDHDRAAIARGCRLILSLDGAEVPWAIQVVEEPS